MMRIDRFACLFALIAGPAVAGGPTAPADEPPVVVPDPVVAVDWTGFYAGVSYGAGRFEPAGPQTELDTDLVGAQLGYLHDLGTFVVGGELAYVSGDFDAAEPGDFTSIRAKLIGGYDAGRLLPYAFLGVSNYDFITPGVTFSDTATIYGVGARYALGAEGRIVVGLEYLVETKDDFDGTGSSLDSSDVSLRLDYRF